MIQAKIHKYHALILLSAIFCLYLFFNIKIHQWESYWYASALEGLSEAADIHRLFGVDINAQLDYNIYQPNHPLLHFIVYGIYKVTAAIGMEVRTLDIVQFLNIVFAMFFLGMTYTFFIKVSSSKIFSSLLVLFISTTDLFWYYAMSGEVYLLPNTFLVLCFYLLMQLEQQVGHQNTRRILILLAISFSLAVCFHLISFVFIAIILYAFYLLKKQSDTFLMREALSILFVIGFLFASIFYGIFFVLFINVDSIQTYFDSIFVLHKVLGWEFTYQDSTFFEFLGHVGAKLHSLLHSLIRSNSFLIKLYKLIILGTLSYSLISLNKKKQKNVFQKITFAWFIVMAFVLVFVITAPSNDYWMFLLWPMSLLIFNLFEKKIMLKPLIVIICILITFQAYVNFTYDIYPKSQAGPKDLSLLAHLGQELNEIDHYIFVFDGEGERFFNEIWYINYIRKQKSIKLINAQHLETMLDITNENDFLAALGIVKGTRIGIVSHHSITSYYHSKLQANNIFIDDSPVIGKVLSPRVYALTNKLARSINLNLTKVLGKNENFIYEKLAQYPYWYNPYKFKPYFLNFQIFNNAN